MEVTVGGAKAFVHTGGVAFDPGNPTLVLIHGAGQDHSFFRFQSRHLAHRGIAALAPDLPAHGRSEGDPLGSIEEMAEWILELLDVLGVGSVSMLGHSMGSLVAIEVAARSQERVERLTLTGPAEAMQVHPELQAAADRGDRLAVELIAGWTHRGEDRFGGHPQPGSWSEGITLRLNEAQLRRSLASDLRACAAYRPLDRAALVACPVDVVVGTRDAMTPAAAGRRLAEALPKARLVEVEGAGHSLLFERPQIVNRLLLEQLDDRR